MTWLLAAAGWATAAVFRGLISVNRRRVASLRAELGATRYDLSYATEKLQEYLPRMNRAEDEVMRLSGQLRARELDEAAKRRRMSN